MHVKVKPHFFLLLLSMLSLFFFFLCLSLYIYIYMVFITERFFQVAIESWLEWVWTHDHWIPFRRSNRLSYQTMSSTRTQSQLCTAAPISSLYSMFTFRLLPSPVTTIAFNKSRIGNHVSSGMIDKCVFKNSLYKKQWNYLQK